MLKCNENSKKIELSRKCPDFVEFNLKKQNPNLLDFALFLELRLKGEFKEKLRIEVSYEICREIQ